jgi:hypothetical protein
MGQLHAGFEAGLQSDLGVRIATVIARSEATRQSILHLARRDGLLRFARNDGGKGRGDNLSCSHAANCLPKKAFPGYPSLL